MMMGRLKFFALFSFITLAIQAQFNSEFLKYADYRQHVSLFGDFEINSNSINNKFLQKFYLGGYIDSALKANVSSKMLSTNYFGGNVSFGANAFWGKDSSDFVWFAGIKNQEIINGSYPREMFNLAFYGNKMYKGEKAYLSNSNFNYLKFQEVKLGFVWTNVDTVGKIGGALSLLKGQSLFQFKTLDTNYLYTAPDASMLEYQANFAISMSDTSKRKFTDANGYGISGDFYVETPYKSRLGPSKFIITVNNLGFIRWNKKSVNYTVDSVFQFSGIHINNLSDLKDSTLAGASKDSLLNNLTSVTSEKVNTNLPMNLIFIHQIDFTKNISFRAGIRHIFNGNYKPYVFLDGRFRVAKGFYAGVMLAHGGYGTFAGGLYLEGRFKDTWYLKAGSNSLQGLVDTGRTRGQSAYLTLSMKLK